MGFQGFGDGEQALRLAVVVATAQLVFALGEGAGFVEEDAADVGEAVEGVAVFDEDVVFVRVVERGGEYGRGGERQRAGAGGDEDGKGDVEGARGLYPLPEEVAGGSEDEYGEDGLLGEGLVAVDLWRAVLFGARADAADGGEGGLLAGLGDADVERALQVGATCVYAVAAGFVLWGAFAGEHIFVDAAGAAGDFAIDGDGVGWQDTDVVARLDGGQRYELRFATVVVFVDGVGQEAGEVLLVVAGAAAGVRFKVAADADEEDEHGDAVVVDFAAANEGVVEAGEPSAGAGECDGQIHVWLAVAQAEPGVFEVGVAGVEHDRRGAEEADPAQQLFVFVVDAVPGAGVEAGREHHHLHHAEAGDDEAQEVVVAFAPLFVVFFVRGVQVRGVAEAGDGGEDGGERGVAPADFSAAGAEVDAGVVDAVRVLQGVADEPGAGSAVQAVNVEVDFLVVAVFIGVLRGDFGEVVGLPVRGIVGVFGARRRAVAHLVVLFEVMGADDVRDGLAGVAAVGVAVVVGDVDACRNGLLAVVAVHGLARGMTAGGGGSPGLGCGYFPLIFQLLSAGARLRYQVASVRVCCTAAGSG